MQLWVYSIPPPDLRADACRWDGGTKGRSNHRTILESCRQQFWAAIFGQCFLGSTAHKKFAIMILASGVAKTFCKG